MMYNVYLSLVWREKMIEAEAMMNVKAGRSCVIWSGGKDPSAMACLLFYSKALLLAFL